MERSRPSDEPKESGQGVKRRRVALACDACRTRKSRCDGGRPRCAICSNLGFECNYTIPSSATNLLVQKDYLQALESRVNTLEESLGSMKSQLLDLSNFVYQKGDAFDPKAKENAVGPPEPESLPELANIEDSVDAMGSVVFADEEDCGFFGPSSNIAFLRHISRKGASSIRPQKKPNTLTFQQNTFDGGFINISRPPSPLSKGTGYPLRQKPVDLFSLPSRDETLELVHTYFSDTGLLYPYIHPPTFLETYQHVIEDNLRKVRRTWLGLLNMMFAMVKITAFPGGRPAEVRISEANVFYQRALGLCGNEMLRGTTIEVVQFLLLMGQYLQGTQKPVQAWTIHGLAVKAALQLGLHSKDASRAFSPLEQEIRKRTWYGCVVLDRTLCMTLGRPTTIPDSYVRLDLPTNDENLVVHGVTIEDLQMSALFFNSTILLYKNLYTIIDLLYGQNLGCDPPLSVGESIGHILSIGHNLVTWEKSLPESIQIVTMKEIRGVKSPTPGGPQFSLKFRVILTLRYLHLQIMLHRPILVKFIDMCGNKKTNSHEERLLQQIGFNSIQICSDAAMNVIDIIHELLNSSEWHKSLLGAWWFSLYYTFHSALILLGTIRISKDANCSVEYKIGQIDAYPNRAVQTLSKLDTGNRIVDRCRYYLERFSNQFNPSDGISQTDSRQLATDNPLMGVADYDLTSSPLGLEFGEFMLDGDFWAVMSQLNDLNSSNNTQ